MKLQDFPLLTDENLTSEVIAHLRQTGFDVVDVRENGWEGESDSDLLKRAFTEGRLVVTHDGDFGTLAIQNGQPFIGILYVRPGHFDSAVTIDTINRVLQLDPDLQVPFLLVAKRGMDQVNIRIRLVTK